MLVHDWAVKLAADVAPDEAILAPIVIDAFLAGGEERKALFARSGSTIGGFGAGDFAAVMPGVFQALVIAAPMLVTALSSSATEHIVSGLDNITKLLELRDRAQKTQATESKGSIDLRRGHSDHGSKLPGPAVESLSPDILHIVETMRAELKKSGIKSETCDAVSYRALKVLFADPPGASRFLRAMESH